MAIPNFNQWSGFLSESDESKPMSFKTDGSYDPQILELQKSLNIIFADLPKVSGANLLSADGRYGKNTKSRIKDFQLLLKSAFSEDGSKNVKIDGMPSEAVFTTARDIAKMGISKAFSLK